jgi:hypothetical protein
MKKSILSLSVLLICFSCNQKTDTSVQSEIIEPVDPMEGVWEQTNYHYLVNDDTTYSSDEEVQHKIYLDGYVIWASTMDTTQFYGLGTYEFMNNIVIEKLLISPPTWNTEQTEFQVKVDVNDNSFSQIIESVSNDTTIQIIEVYKRIKK